MPSEHVGARPLDVALDALLLLLSGGVAIGAAVLVGRLAPNAAPAVALLLGGLGSGLCFVVAVECYVRWTLVGDGVAIRLALAFVIYGSAVAPLVARTADGAVGSVLQALGTVLAAGALLLAARSPEVDARFPVARATSLVAVALLGTVAAVGTVPGLASRLAGTHVGNPPAPALLELVVVLATAAVLSVLGLRRGRRALTACGVALVGLAAAPVVMAVGAHGIAGPLLASASQFAGLWLVAHTATSDARHALATASRYDLDLTLRWRAAVARAEAVVRVEHERSHEIRSALLVVEGAGRALSRRLDEMGDTADAGLADAVHSEARRLQRIVAAIQDEPPTGYGLLDVLQPLVAAHRATGQRIRLDVPPDLSAQGRPHALAEVVSNLLVNAARHAPDAAVTITGSRGSRPGYLRLVVADDGPGFPAGGLAHAVERGWRGFGASSPGSGLGLYLSSHLMEQEGGTLTLVPPQAPGARGAVVALDVRADAGPAPLAVLDDLADAS